jgi:peptidoglycan/xylan/chitin deacetylase (PgdA/CDA1 family)
MLIGPVFYILSLFLLPFLPSNSSVESNYTVKQPKIEAQHQSSDKTIKHIYLTFDDGPLKGTANCIAVCEREKVAASFFEIGLHQSRSNKGRKLYEQIKSNKVLFSLSNHSFSHAAGNYLWFYQHPDSATLDFLKGKAVLAPTNNLVRFPGNNTWDTKNAKKASWLAKPLAHKMDSLGWDVIGWDMEWRFNKYGKPLQSPEVIAVLVDSLFTYNQTKTKNHLVILMHDHMFASSYDSLKLAKMVGLLKKRKHYQFDKITQYPGLKNALN